MTSARSFLPMRRGKLLVATVGILGLAGCATFSDDGGFGRVEQTTRERLDKDVKWARSDAERTTLQTRVGELLAKPLMADDAIQLALYNNRGLQAAFFRSGHQRGRTGAGRALAQSPFLDAACQQAGERYPGVQD